MPSWFSATIILALTSLSRVLVENQSTARSSPMRTLRSSTASHFCSQWPTLVLTRKSSSSKSRNKQKANVTAAMDPNSSSPLLLPLGLTGSMSSLEKSLTRNPRKLLWPLRPVAVILERQNMKISLPSLIRVRCRQMFIRGKTT